MIPASPNLSLGTPRAPQMYVRKFRLETQEADAWQLPERTSLALRARRRTWIFAGSVVSAGSLLIWVAWQWA